MKESKTATIKRYNFLLSQLVKRDFKKKYRGSILGVLWTLLNPLSLMLIQYLVFSKLFRFDIPNFAVYLLVGIVVFNFISDSTSCSLGSVIENSNLIKKVKVPLTIYPLSRVLSCCINFAFSVVALYVVILSFGTPITYHHVYLIYCFLCLFVFSVGLSYLLAALIVFFRDVRFLYSIFLILWSYMTPIFYPETIYTKTLAKVVKFNPMYHFIKFARTIILEHQCPSWQLWLYVFGFAGIMFLIGWFVYYLSKKKFILYI